MIYRTWLIHNTDEYIQTISIQFYLYYTKSQYSLYIGQELKMFHRETNSSHNEQHFVDWRKNSLVNWNCIGIY